jgi:Xaa-Pro aminopeptidase
LILLDVGGEYYNFASDITRTYPANGKFTEAQLDVRFRLSAATYDTEDSPPARYVQIYNAVLGVNKKIIELAKPEINGQKMTLNVLHRLSAQMLSSELIRLGILPKSNAVRIMPLLR